MAARSTPAAVLECAERCVGVVHAACDLSLDFTPDTFPILDHYLSEARDLPRDPAGDPVRGLVAALTGAYFGEVVRRTLPARWAAADPEPLAWRIEFERCLLTFHPVPLAWEVLLRREIPGMTTEFMIEESERDEITSRLGGLPGVTERDYYTFTQRFETLSFIVGWLVESSSVSRREARRHARGLTPARYRQFLASLRTRE